MQSQLHKEDWNNRGPLPLIWYMPKPTIGMTLTYKSYYLKVDIKTQPG